MYTRRDAKCSDGQSLNGRTRIALVAKPAELLTALLTSLPSPDPAWISIIDQAALSARLTQLAEQLQAVNGDLTRLPLYGVPFAAKDNIDVAGLPTTAACPAFAYAPAKNATIIRGEVAMHDFFLADQACSNVNANTHKKSPDNRAFLLRLE